MLIFPHFGHTLLFLLINFQYSWIFASPSEDFGQAHFRNDEPCPNAEDIKPCKCTYDEDANAMDMDCNGIHDEDELAQVFSAVIPFPKFRKLTLNTTHLETLPDTVFGEVSFQEVETLSEGGILSSVDTQTFEKSVSRLISLNLQNNELPDFPFVILYNYTALTDLDLSHNPISDFPTIKSETLTYLNLSNANFTVVPESSFDVLAQLIDIDISGNKFDDTTSLSPGLFESLSNLESISVRNAQLKSVTTEQFTVNDKAKSVTIDLSGNHITAIEVDAFKNVKGASIINMCNNLITELPSETWESLIEAGNTLQLAGNDLTCGCDVAWLVLEDKYHAQVTDATCHSGEKLIELDPKFFDLCP